MKVKLNWITPDAESRIAKMARVSNQKNEDNPEYVKLIRYLIEHRHWSPFEMVNMCVEIETTRAISAQILRHRSFSFQEFSQRYAEVEDVTGNTEWPNFRMQDKKNRQNSTVCSLPQDERDWLNFKIEHAFKMVEDAYQSMLDAGVAKEVARGVLPMNTKTRLHMNGTVRSWIHYLQVRCERSTQKEHRDVADAVALILKEHLPCVFEAANLGDLLKS